MSASAPSTPAPATGRTSWTPRARRCGSLPLRVHAPRVVAGRAVVAAELLLAAVEALAARDAAHALCGDRAGHQREQHEQDHHADVAFFVHAEVVGGGDADDGAGDHEHHPKRYEIIVKFKKAPTLGCF